MCRPDKAKTSLEGVELKSCDEWVKKFDLEGFTEEIRALGKKLELAQGPDDVAHLNLMISYSNAFAAVGLLSMGFGVNPITMMGLSLYAFSRWTMIAHHTCHGGYERCHPNKGRWSRFKFAVGSTWRRFNDWFDWMLPEAWNVEHNNRHHYNLSEDTDPDLVERNTAYLRELDAPRFVKYLIVGFIFSTWKWFYYAPNTYKELKMAQWRKQGKKIPAGAEDPITLKDSTPMYSFFEMFTVVLMPYLVFHFFITPIPFLVLGEYLDGYTGKQMYMNAIINLFLAEWVTNIHGSIAIITNHAGNDMYRFKNACRPFSGSFYLRQVLASVDFDLGTDSIDFMHGWLNYQIEHHLWPNLSMLSYRKAAPQVQEICERYGVPYVKENVFIRLKKTVDIMVGKDSMRVFPEEYEQKYLEIDAVAELKQYSSK
mmetsp:Transcript_8871/g.11799  ORF Transcript_8871/g.11799 Transcript_8871/m.11799 type:complete len:426 (+) Transcript_8871:317-1594(+)|eukprot:CAMPEP_0198138934 /NCGR_PEP_ID=MMETSP1443-20131203/2295_1 /TAXON_ID=186043 /ORGANISM="Entomoneis sp., Strain CCMP2396" /LENGTH=425 /DNA_ID=CAMNT_0043800891 /DNA_START=207 /DNA_END=1484 /DNA_ORIENTATION=+